MIEFQLDTASGVATWRMRIPAVRCLATVSPAARFARGRLVILAVLLHGRRRPLLSRSKQMSLRPEPT